MANIISFGVLILALWLLTTACGPATAAAPAAAPAPTIDVKLLEPDLDRIYMGLIESAIRIDELAVGDCPGDLLGLAQTRQAEAARISSALVSKVKSGEEFDQSGVAVMADLDQAVSRLEDVVRGMEARCVS